MPIVGNNTPRSTPQLSDNVARARGCITRGFAAVGVRKPSGEQFGAVAVGAPEPREHALQYRLTADDEVLDAVAAFDADRAITKLGLEIRLPQIGRLQ